MESAGGFVVDPRYMFELRAPRVSSPNPDPIDPPVSMTRSVKSDGDLPAESAMNEYQPKQSLVYLRARLFGG